MSIPEIVTNAGDLFNAEELSALAESGVLTEDQVREQYEQIREHYERRRGQLNNGEEPLDKDSLGFFFIGRVLHILGYTHSHNEPLPSNTGRVDYTLFDTPDDFISHENGRGSSQLYAGAVAVLKLLGFGAPLDGEGEVGEATPDAPAFELDDVLRQTGLQWAMLSNGKAFRLYHRNTAGMLNTFCEVDLKEILDTADYPGFRFFSAIFSREALLADDSGTSPARRILA